VYGSLGYVAGKLNLDSELASTDAETAHTAGHFSKWTLDVVRKQSLPDGLEGNIRLSGQWSHKNLDSSEKFSLGGANGVRAYPTGEALGDQGWLAQAELRGQWEQVNPYAFIDAGAVKAVNQPWDTSASNTRNLLGSGVGVRTVQGDWTLDASLAWRLNGGVPQSDPSDRRPRMWMSLAYKL
jgi:hemolysin activation/secretion protein